MKKIKVLSIVLLLITIVSFYEINSIFHPFAEQVNRYPSNLGDFNKTGSYVIDSNTIISSLNSGKADVFSPNAASPENLTPSSTSPTQVWRESDFLKVASALHQFVWQESWDAWNLYFAKFDINCNSDLNGFSVGEFIFYKTVWVNGSVYYSARDILIQPSDNAVSWGGDTDFPHPVFGWNGVDIKEIKVDANTALQIAEQGGGSAYRSSVHNKCNISLGLSGDYGWHIIYIGDKGLIDFEFFVNPYSDR